MRSFIFNSSLSLFVGAFLCLTIAGRFVPASAPNLSSEYYALGGGGLDDYASLFHGTNGTLSSLKAAEIIFLGTSRIQFALKKDLLCEYFEELGLSYYLLGFGWQEPLPFPRRILEKFDLRPKAVIVDVSDFFKSEPTGWAQQAMRSIDFENFKSRVESAFAPWFHVSLGWLLPYRFRVTPADSRMIYRSRRDGTWLVPPPVRGPYTRAFSPHIAKEKVPEPSEILLARDFVKDMRAKGIAVFLIHVPGPTLNWKASRQIADALSIPLHSPDVGELESFDGMHLTPESANRFVPELLKDLKKDLSSLAASEKIFP